LSIISPYFYSFLTSWEYDKIMEFYFRYHVTCLSTYYPRVFLKKTVNLFSRGRRYGIDILVQDFRGEYRIKDAAVKVRKPIDLS
jgi:hypothetical protein